MMLLSVLPTISTRTAGHLSGYQKYRHSQTIDNLILLIHFLLTFKSSVLIEGNIPPALFVSEKYLVKSVVCEWLRSRFVELRQQQHYLKLHQIILS